MNKIRGWGSLFAVALPLILWYVWSTLGAQTSRIAIERYSEWQSKEMPSIRRDLTEFYLRNKKVAGPDDVILPPNPPESGIHSWAIGPDTTVTIRLDAIIKGRPVELHFVPVVQGTNSIDYQCVSDTPKVYLNSVCYAETMQTTADIPAQLNSNKQVIDNLPDIISSTGEVLEAGTAVGSVLVVPHAAEDLHHCGYQCVKLKNCAAVRQIACGKIIEQDGKRWFSVQPSNIQVKGGKITSRTAANRLCEEALGAGFQILSATSVTGVISLDGGYEYWVHDDLRKENNCWSAD